MLKNSSQSNGEKRNCRSWYRSDAQLISCCYAAAAAGALCLEKLRVSWDTCRWRHMHPQTARQGEWAGNVNCTGRPASSLQAPRTVKKVYSITADLTDNSTLDFLLASGPTYGQASGWNEQTTPRVEAAGRQPITMSQTAAWYSCNTTVYEATDAPPPDALLNDFTVHIYTCIKYEVTTQPTQMYHLSLFIIYLSCSADFSLVVTFNHLFFLSKNQ